MADPIFASSEVKESSLFNNYKYFFLFFLILFIFIVFILFFKILSHNEVSSENNSLSNYSVKNNNAVSEPLPVPVGNEKYNSPLSSNISVGLAVQTNVSTPPVVFNEGDTLPVQTLASSLPEQNSSAPAVVFNEGDTLPVQTLASSLPEQNSSAPAVVFE